MNKIYLAQTDTTVGFLCEDYKKLNSIKNRDIEQKVLREVNSFDTLKSFTRIPNKFKSKVRRSKKTTFIYPNQQSFRVVDDATVHYDFIQKFKVIYSTSANLTNKKFDLQLAQDKSDIIIYTKNDFYETTASNLYKINNQTIKKLR